MSQDRTPKKTATQELDRIISHYRSVENKRIALRKALETHPDDPHLVGVKEKLTDIHQIRSGIQRGVFMSYSRPDELFTLELILYLRGFGVKVWFDTMEIWPGKDWRNEIDTAMNECSIMFSVLSPAALEDEDAAKERERFIGLGKLILPVVCTPCKIEDDAFWLRPIDFTHDFNLGLYMIEKLLSQPSIVASA